MKLQRYSRGKLSVQSYEFCQGSLRVEVNRERAVIETPGETFLPAQRLAFLRYLIAEGFIPKGYQAIWINSKASSMVEWRTKQAKSAKRLKEARAARNANRFMLRLLACGLVAWVIEMLALLLTRGQ